MRIKFSSRFWKLRIGVISFTVGYLALFFLWLTFAPLFNDQHFASGISNDLAEFIFMPISILFELVLVFIPENSALGLIQPRDPNDFFLFKTPTVAGEIVGAVMVIILTYALVSFVYGIIRAARRNK